MSRPTDIFHIFHLKCKLKITRGQWSEICIILWCVDLYPHVITVLCTLCHLCWQSAVCRGHASWAAALQDIGSICYRTQHEERHRSRRIFRTQRNNGTQALVIPLFLVWLKTVKNDSFGFPKVKWLHRTAEVDKYVRLACRIFSEFNVPKIIKIG